MKVQFSLEEYQDFLRNKSKKDGDKLLPSTIERYSDFMGHHIDGINKLISVNALIQYMNNSLISVNSIVLYSAFKNLLLMWNIPNEIIKKLETPRANISALKSKRFLQSKVLSKGELIRLFNEIKDDKLRAIISVLYDTGVRRAELLSIKFGDIIWNYNKKSREETGIYATINIIGKGQKARKVHLHRTSARLIHELYKSNGYTKEDNVFVFKHRGGSPLSYQCDALKNLIKKECSRILKRHIHPHMFRHTLGTHMADEGADLLDIAAYLGHENPKTTMIYVEISNRRAKSAFINYVKDIQSASS